jgi:hypothetical protein
MAEIYNSIVPNKIKIDYTSNGSSNNLHYDSNFLNINTWYFGIDVNRNYAPSSGTGWYQGIDALTIDDRTYTIYYTGSTTGRTNNVNDYYRCVQYSDTQDVVNFVNSQAGFSVTDFSEALNWFKHDASAGNGTSGRGGGGPNVCVNMNYPNIPTSGLTFALDAGHAASYPFMNPTWYDFTQSAMSGFSGSSRILQHFDEGNLFFDFSDNGAFDSVEFFTNTTYNRNLGSGFTIIFWAKPVVSADGASQYVFSCAPTIGTPINQSVGFYNSKTNIRFYYAITDSSGTVKTRIGTANINTARWHQFTYVFEPNSGGTTTTSFYLDDTLSETNTETFSAASWSPSSPNWVIGQSSPANTIGKTYYGGLQVLLVYSRVLSETEISDIYSNYLTTRGLFA